MSTAPFSVTQHPPVGAWSSLTFGLPGQGVSIDHEDLAPHDSADLLVALSHGPGQTVALPFVTGTASHDYEQTHARPESAGHYRDRFTFLAPPQLTRTLSPCTDTFSSPTITLTVYTPFPSIPNPKRSGQPQFYVCPGILMEVTFDNSGSDLPATGFVGLGYRGRGRIRPMDWSTNGALVGVGFASQWCLAALAGPHVATLRDNSIAEHVEAGTPVIHNGGQEGGILVKVGPRQKITMPVTFAFYHGGIATQGIDGSYYYTQFFIDLEAVAHFTLRNVGKIRESCANFDAKIAAAAPDPAKQAAIGQGLRGYNANSQLILSNNIPYFSVMGGQFTWRNALDLAVDHLPWELYRNTWIVRNVFDLYSAHYSYRDELLFPADGDGNLNPGGLSYCHDVGSGTTYTPAGNSAYEMPNLTGGYSFMTSEELLNGVYLLASYAIVSDDEPWSRTRLATAKELLDSLEARDHVDPAKRTGILKAESSICGPKGAEITTYDSLDASLKPARGSIVLAVKTWCATLMLTAYFQQHNDAEAAQRSYNFAHMTATALAGAFDAAGGSFPANLFAPGDAKVLAMFEPMAVPAYCHLKHYFAEFPDLMAKMKTHAATCLKPGVCLDAGTGAMKLSSGSTIVYPSKIALVMWVLENILEMPLTDYPQTLTELAHWARESGAEGTYADQVDAATRQALGGYYSPRLASAAMWLKTNPVSP